MEGTSEGSKCKGETINQVYKLHQIPSTKWKLFLQQGSPKQLIMQVMWMQLSALYHIVRRLMLMFEKGANIITCDLITYMISNLPCLENIPQYGPRAETYWKYVIVILPLLSIYFAVPLLDDACSLFCEIKTILVSIDEHKRGCFCHTFIFSPWAFMEQEGWCLRRWAAPSPTCPTISYLHGAPPMDCVLHAMVQGWTRV